MFDINKFIYDFLHKPVEQKQEKKVEMVIKEDGKVTDYPRKKKKLTQKDVFVSVVKK